MAMTMIDRLATNMTMEVKAATSRIISVIVLLRFAYVLYMFFLFSGVNSILEGPLRQALQGCRRLDPRPGDR